MREIIEALYVGQVVAAPVASAGLLLTLVTLSIIDLRTMRLPDLLTLPLMASGIALNLWWGGIELGARSVIGASVGYGVIWLLATYWKRRFGRDGIGLGDAKLLAAGGAWCGPFLLPLILLVSSGLGLAVAFLVWLRRGNDSVDLGRLRVPFGPFLAVGIGVGWFLVPRLA